jgi:hypothetical protein
MATVVWPLLRAQQSIARLASNFAFFTRGADTQMRGQALLVSQNDFGFQPYFLNAANKINNLVRHASPN